MSRSLASSNGNIARVKIYVYHDSYRNHLGGSIDTLSTDTTINQRREEHECKEVIRIRCSSYFRMRQGSKLFEFLNFFLSLFIFYLYLFSPSSHKRAHTHVHNDTQFARNSGDYTSDSTIKGRRKLVVKL